jgi:hypothetical protein
MVFVGPLMIAAGCSSAGHHQGAFRPTPGGPGQPTSTPSITVVDGGLVVGGELVVGFHGLEVAVPASWQINATSCGTPVADTVVRDAGITPACGSARSPRVDSVELFDNPQQWFRTRRGLRDYVNPHGVLLRVAPEIRGQGRPVLVPAVGVVALIQTTSPAETTRILNALQLSSTDITGCRMHERVLYPPARYRPPDRGELTTAVIPPGPEAIAICHYGDNWLLSSTIATGGQLTELVHRADTGATGYAHAPPGDYLASICTAPTTDGGEAGSGYVLIARYAQRAPVRLWAHIGSCGPLGLTNGLRTSRLTDQLAAAIAGPLLTGFGLPGTLLPGPP